MSKPSAFLATLLAGLLFIAHAGGATLTLSYSSVLTKLSGLDQAGLDGASLQFRFTTSQTHYLVGTFSTYDFNTDSIVPVQANYLIWDTLTLTITGSTAGNDGAYALTSQSSFYGMPRFNGLSFALYPSVQSTPTNLGLPNPTFALYTYAEGPLATANPALGALIQAGDFSPSSFLPTYVAYATGIPLGSTYRGQSPSFFTAIPEPVAPIGTLAALLGLTALARRTPPRPHPLRALRASV